jgi:hypothetical protein
MPGMSAANHNDELRTRDYAVISLDYSDVGGRS